MILDKNEIILRPRFKILVETNHLLLIERFKELKKDLNQQYISKVVQNYIVLDIPEEENKFWSPQLEVRIDPMEENLSEISCLYGPKSIVWTFFIFVHFAVAGIFFVSFVIAYTNWRLHKPLIFPISVCAAMVLFWIILYFLGRIGKRLAKNQMQELHAYFCKVIKE